MTTTVLPAGATAFRRLLKTYFGYVDRTVLPMRVFSFKMAVFVLLVQDFSNDGCGNGQKWSESEILKQLDRPIERDTLVAIVLC